jgi:hypothetical protein
MGQIVNALSWSKTVHFDLTDLGGVHTAIVRITLTRRKG